MDSFSNESNKDNENRNGSLLGPIFLWSGAVLGILLFCEKLGGLPFDMPSSWYTNSAFWIMIAIMLFGMGIKLIADSKPEEVAWKPTKNYPRFHKIVVYSREDCHLCHEAEQLLAKYYEFLPIPEIIDVNEYEELDEKFGNCVPVVEIDGKIRFRGKIEEELLKRLIENAPVTNLPVIEK